MRYRVFALAVVACGACGRETPASPTTGPNPPLAQVLVVTHTTGFRHDSIPVAEAVLERLGQTSGLFTVRFCRTAFDVAAAFAPDGLATLDAVVFANTTGDLGIPDLPALLAWIGAGHGFAGIHSATDTYHGEPAYLEMIGNEFRTHGNQAEVQALVENRTHPASAPLGDRLRIFDEIYKFVRPNRDAVTMLLSLDRHPDDGLPEAGTPGDLPLAWAKSHGQGRVFYTALGHREDVWQNPLFQQHLLGGLRWAVGR